MPDATVKISDGIREITVELNGTDDDPLSRAEETASRLYHVARANSPGGHRTGFNTWALSSDTERSPDE